MLDSKFRKLKDYFGVSAAADWQDITPGAVLAIDGVGPVTLEHLRIYLAAKNLTLKNDQTPEYWRANLSRVKIGHELGDDDTQRVAPFTVLIDSAETQPFTFHGIPDDRHAAGTFVDAFGDRHARTLIVPTEWRCLGRYPDSLGDYSIDGGVGRVHVERKSMEDLQSTVLGFAARGDDGPGRRERFECELANLSRIEAACVIVECDFADAIRNAPEWGKRTSQQNAKTLTRSILAYTQDYSVPWIWAGSRRMAELLTYRWFARWWEKRRGERKEVEKLIAAI